MQNHETTSNVLVSNSIPWRHLLSLLVRSLHYKSYTKRRLVGLSLSISTHSLLGNGYFQNDHETTCLLMDSACGSIGAKFPIKKSHV